MDIYFVVGGNDRGLDLIYYIQTISIIIASFVALYGINAWRREFIGKRKADLAEEVLSLFYESRDAIRNIRNPFYRSGEGSSRKRNDNETPEEAKAYDNAYVVFERYEMYKDTFNRLRSLKYRSMAYWGTDVEKPFDHLTAVMDGIFAAANMCREYWMEIHCIADRVGLNEEEVNDRVKKVDKFERIIREGLSEDDPVNAELDDVITEIESKCKSVLFGMYRSRWLASTE